MDGLFIGFFMITLIAAIVKGLKKRPSKTEKTTLEIERDKLIELAKYGVLEGTTLTEKEKEDVKYLRSQGFNDKADELEGKGAIISRHIRRYKGAPLLSKLPYKENCQGISSYTGFIDIEKIKGRIMVEDQDHAFLARLRDKDTGWCDLGLPSTKGEAEREGNYKGRDGKFFEQMEDRIYISNGCYFYLSPVLADNHSVHWVLAAEWDTKT